MNSKCLHMLFYMFQQFPSGLSLVLHTFLYIVFAPWSRHLPFCSTGWKKLLHQKFSEESESILTGDYDITIQYLWVHSAVGIITSQACCYGNTFQANNCHFFIKVSIFHWMHVLCMWFFDCSTISRFMVAIATKSPLPYKELCWYSYIFRINVCAKYPESFINKCL